MKPLKLFVEAKIRLDRGSALVSWFRNIVLIVASIKILFPLFTLFHYIVLSLLIVGAFLVIGSLDLDRIKILQLEQKLLTSKYNPHLNNIKKAERGKK